MAMCLDLTGESFEDLNPRPWAELPPEGVFVDEMTQCGCVSRLGFDVYRPKTFLSGGGGGYQGTLSYGFATALGATHARRDVPVLSIVGDGGALFTVDELATAVHRRIPLITIVFNDHVCGNVRRIRQLRFDDRVIGQRAHQPRLREAGRFLRRPWHAGEHSRRAAPVPARITWLR